MRPRQCLECGVNENSSLRRLHLNDKHYFVEPPKREKISPEEINKLGDVRSIVAQVKSIIFGSGNPA